jgi:ATP-dependent Clp protease adaptor protein ClpS
MANMPEPGMNESGFSPPGAWVSGLRRPPLAPEERMLRLQERPGVVTRPRPATRKQVARPPLHKVILLNDDFTPREFVVRVLKAEFRLSEDQANRVMITAHTKGKCVVAVFTREIAETKATRATDMAREAGYPLLFTTEPEE